MSDEYGTSDSSSVSDSDTDTVTAPAVVFTSALDPMRTLPGGVYLDEVERAKAEVARAKLEGREPDLENPPAIQSTPVINVDALTHEQKGILADAQEGRVTNQAQVFQGEPDVNAGAADVKTDEPVTYDSPTGKFDPADEGQKPFGTVTVDLTDESNKE